MLRVVSERGLQQTLRSKSDFAPGLVNLRAVMPVMLNITSESRGDVTCDSLGDVIWSHGTHDVKRSVRKVRHIWMRKQHQESQNRLVMSTRGVLLLWFQINRN
jgi:hypothetical protein